MIQGTNTPVPGGFGAMPILFNGQPTAYKEYVYKNVRRSFTQEVRFSSNPGNGPFSWVAGLYYNVGHQRQPGSALATTMR